MRGMKYLQVLERKLKQVLSLKQVLEREEGDEIIMKPKSAILTPLHKPLLVPKKLQ